MVRETRGRVGCRAERGEARARDPSIHPVSRLQPWSTITFKSLVEAALPIMLELVPKLFFKESMSEGSVQGDSNNDKLMVSTKCLFDLFRFSLMTFQRAKPFWYLLGYLSNTYHMEA